jgi:hypothetical protein
MEGQQAHMVLVNLATSALEIATYSTECVKGIASAPMCRKLAAVSLKQREVDLTTLVYFSSAERAFYPRTPQQQSNTGQAKEIGRGSLCAAFLLFAP